MIIHRTSVVEQVIDYLKSRISRGVWKPGEKITSELELVSQLQVSRASVHNAIQQLIAIGVLESFQGKGTFVKSVPLDEIDNRLRSITENSTMKKLIEFRLIIEVEGCKRAAKQLSENTISEMETCLEGMKDNRAHHKKFVNFDIQYHRALLQATRNEIIVKSMDIIREEMQRQSLIYMTPGSIENAIHYHEEIIDCLKKHDWEGASKTMLAHLQSTEEGAEASTHA
jgi:GntR family transcriptional repressor for pyruvate dehydrogenase complex